MRKKKQTNNTLLFISIGLIFLAILLTAIIGKVTNNESATDLRAKAGFSSSLRLEGVVKSVDSSSGTFIVDDVHFIYKSRKDSEENLGSWTVTPPEGFSLGSLAPGSAVILNANPNSFLVSSHTMTAAKIEFK